MIGYQNSPELKARFTAHVERHRQQDSLLRGTYGTMTGDRFRGCAVSCSLRSLDEIDGRPLKVDNNNHADLADRLGIPLVLAYLEDRIFEGLPEKEALLWPTLFARAIPVGADLSQVWPHFAVWMLADPHDGVIRFANSEQTRKAINDVADLFREQAIGKEVAAARWSAVAAAAARWSVAADAADAAAARWSADAARWSAAAARWSADAARWSADAARWSADAAARQKHYVTMAGALLRFMSEALIRQVSA